MAISETQFVPGTTYEVVCHGEYDVKVVYHRGHDKEKAEMAFASYSESQARSTGITKTVELYEVRKTLLASANEDPSNA